MKEIYLIHMEDTNFYKIGVSSNTRTRLSSIQCGNPHRVYERHYIFSSDRDARPTEKQLHLDFRDRHVRGEWFQFSRDKLSEVIARMNELHNNRNTTK